MKIKTTFIEDCKIIQPDVYKDERGYFLESFQKEKYANILSDQSEFVQDNISFSKKNVLRGLHFQRNNPQGKLVRVLEGKVFDVAVDLRQNSKTFGKHIEIILDHSDQDQLWIPPGFAHGFLTLTESVYFEYKCTNYYDAEDEATLIWNDPDLKIGWPIQDPLLSPKDSLGIKLKDLF